MKDFLIEVWRRIFEPAVIWTSVLIVMSAGILYCVFLLWLVIAGTN